MEQYKPQHQNRVEISQSFAKITSLNSIEGFLAHLREHNFLLKSIGEPWAGFRLALLPKP